jgi:hypothetical protein
MPDNVRTWFDRAANRMPASMTQCVWSTCVPLVRQHTAWARSGRGSVAKAAHECCGAVNVR